jgi:carboxypeptidase C (cathepsin A)
MFNPTNNLPYTLFFPTYAATAWYHKHLSGNSDGIKVLLGEVEDWVMNDYTLGLMKGNSLSEEKREALAESASLYTGLSRDYILNSSLKIRSSRFQKELFRKERQVVGRMDTRFTGPDTDAAGTSPAYDPSLEPFIGTFSSAVNHYVKNDLKFKSDLPYLYLNYRVNRTWDWASAVNHGQGYVNVSQTLTDAMNINRYLKVFIASGYYDLATPYFAARFTVDHMELEKSLLDNISFHSYDAGHMMYIDLPSLKKLTEDVSSFYKKALPPTR